MKTSERSPSRISLAWFAPSARPAFSVAAVASIRGGRRLASSILLALLLGACGGSGTLSSTGGTGGGMATATGGAGGTSTIETSPA